MLLKRFHAICQMARKLADLHTAVQFDGHFSTPVLPTAKTKIWTGYITKPEVHAKFRPNPCTFKHGPNFSNNPMPFARCQARWQTSCLTYGDAPVTFLCGFMPLTCVPNFGCLHQTLVSVWQPFYQARFYKINQTVWAYCRARSSFRFSPK